VSRPVIATIVKPPGISRTRDAMDSSSLSLTIVFMIPTMVNWLVVNAFLPLLCPHPTVVYLWRCNENNGDGGPDLSLVLSFLFPFFFFYSLLLLSF